MNDLSKFRKHAWIGVLALAALALLAWRTLVHVPADAATRSAPPNIAVDTAAVTHADVPIYLSGLGTVQAFYTVTVTARVDGELQKIAFTEGQTVHKGDLLAQIDPRPNQAAYRAGGGDQGQGCGPAGERQARSGALHDTAAAGPGEQADRRHAARHGRSARRRRFRSIRP